MGVGSCNRPQCDGQHGSLMRECYARRTDHSGDSDKELELPGGAAACTALRLVHRTQCNGPALRLLGALPSPVARWFTRERVDLFACKRGEGLGRWARGLAAR